MMIQPASGPGVCDRARWRICLKPLVVISPTRAPFASRSAFVATVVPCITKCSSSGATPLSSQIRLTPISTPCGRIGRGRRRLHAVELPRLVVHEEEVGEGAADVHSEPVGHSILLLVPSAGDRRKRPGAVDLSWKLPLEHALEPLGESRSGRRGRFRSRSLRRGGGRRDPRCRCCPSPSGRTGSLRSRRARRRARSRPTRAPPPRWRSRCCGCCGGGRRSGRRARGRHRRAGAPAAARRRRSCRRRRSRRPRRPRARPRARARGPGRRHPRTGTRTRRRS